MTSTAGVVSRRWTRASDAAVPDEHVVHHDAAGERELVRLRIELRRALVQDVARDPLGVPAATGDEHRRERVQERQPREVEAG